MLVHRIVFRPFLGYREASRSVLPLCWSVFTQTMVACMTEKEYMGQMIVVISGYEGRIDRWLLANEGLTSRFEGVIRFKVCLSPICGKFVAGPAESLGTWVIGCC